MLSLNEDRNVALMLTADMRASDDRSALDVLRSDVTQVFGPAAFCVERRPVSIGRLLDSSDLAALPSCLDMPIMLPEGSVVLPEPYASSRSIAGMLSQAIAFEDQLLSQWRSNRYLYLTVDTRTVELGRTHRNAGWHFDGMQGSRYERKLPACHQYVVSTASPTEFCGVPLDARGLTEDGDNWFEALAAQVPADLVPWTPAPDEIICMSAYQLHRSPVAKAQHRRTFVRLDVSCKQQDRLGNTPNPVLPVPFTYVERHLPAGLGRAVADSSWDGAKRL